jgi:type 1 glutamine amidotransferase
VRYTRGSHHVLALVGLLVSVTCSSGENTPAGSSRGESGGGAGASGTGGSMDTGGSTGTGATPSSEPDAATSDALEPAPGSDAGSVEIDDAGSAVDAGPPGDGGADHGNVVFVFTRTTGFRHASIEPGEMALHDALTPLGLTVETGADPKIFTTAGLARFAGIVLISTTGKPLGDPGTEALDALQAFVRAGGALIGIHGASSTMYDPALPYTTLLGGRFVDHPGSVRMGVCHPASQHPSAAKLPPALTVQDEIYFMDHLRPDNEIDLRCDALTGGGTLPIAWHRAEGKGRVFYTALGHGNEQYAATNPVFKDHMIPGILWALGR